MVTQKQQSLLFNSNKDPYKAQVYPPNCRATIYSCCMLLLLHKTHKPANSGGDDSLTLGGCV